jgi:outer membrane protein assembly factor BamB
MMHTRPIRLLAALLAALCVTCEAAEVKPFTFVQITDTHVGSPDNNADLTAVLGDIRENYPDAAFIVNTGDITDYGTAEELRAYRELITSSPLKIHSIPGNHDSRWADNGKESFKEIVGPTWLVWEHNGVKFIGMDVSMLIEQYAHFDGQQLARLSGELESLDPGQPAVVCVHHPPLSDGRYFDNDQEFADLIRRHNVPLVLMGHGHSLQRYTLNNTTYAMGGAIMQRQLYRVFRVYPDRVEMDTRNARNGKVKDEPPTPTIRPKDTVGELEPGNRADAAPDSPITFRLPLLDGARLVAATWTVDGFLTGTAELAGEGAFSVDPAKLPNGSHQLVATVVDDRGSTHVRSARFTTAAQKAGPGIAREFRMLSASQSHPAVADGVLYAGSNDARLRAFSLRDGSTLWERDLRREIISGPTVTTDTVVVGSLDGHVYCLDRKTGNIVWDVKTGGAVLASPLVSDGFAYVGSGDRNLYGIDLASGDIRWKFPVAGHIKMTPAVAKGKLFFGAWDNWFYCVDARTGVQEWKVPASTRWGLGAATCNPATTGTRVIVATHDYSVRCLDQATGAHLWLYKPRKDELGPSYSGAVIRGDVAYFGSINGHVVGHSVDSGEKVFDVDVRPGKTDALFDSLPVIDGDRIYVGSVGGNLYCVDIPSRRVEWSVAVQPGFVFTRPALADGRIYVASTGDRVVEVAPPQAP